LKFSDLAIVDVHPNPGDYPELVAFLATGHAPEEPAALFLYNCLTQTETVRWTGTIKDGNAPLAGKKQYI
jgi:hypothetical protein